MSNLVIGRAGVQVAVDTVHDVVLDGDELRIRAQTQYGSISAAEVVTQQLNGYVAHADETFVPVLWNEIPDVDGFYRVLSASITRPRESTVFGVYQLDVTLERVQGFAAPTIELTSTGGLRASDAQVITNEFKNPFFDGASAPAADTANISALAIISDGGNNVAKGQTTSSAVAAMRLTSAADRPAASSGQRWWSVATLKNPNATARSLSLGIVFLDGSGVALAYTYSGSVTLASGAQIEFAIDAVAPTGTASVVPVAVRNAGTGAANGDLIYGDAVYLGRTQPLADISPKVFSGATSNLDPAVQHAWTGAANASTSTRTVTWTTGIGTHGAPGHSLTLVDVNNGVTSVLPLSTTNVDGGTVRQFSVNPGTRYAQYSVSPEWFYEAASTLSVGGNVATGRQVQNSPTDWLVSNGLFEIRPKSGATTMVLQMRQYTGTWSAWMDLELTGGPVTGTGLFLPTSLNVVRNDPDRVVIRLLTRTVAAAPGYIEENPTVVDISVSRGNRWAAFEIRSGVATTLGVKPAGFSAAVTINHGWYLASNGSFVTAPRTMGGTNDSIYSSTTTRLWSMGIGFTSVPTGTPDYWQYWFAGTVTARVVARG